MSGRLERTSRLLPHPWLSVALFATWLLLINRLSPGDVVMALFLALTLPAFTRLFWNEVPRFTRYAPVPGLALLFLWDIVVANISVAILILKFWYQPRSQWIVIPLDLKNPMAVAALANMITLTPGTVSAKLTPDRLELLVHVLDTEDPEGEVNRIKQRYERRLQEVFE
jgi:multicomponent K+:H+ antiporter subunit E